MMCRKVRVALVSLGTLVATALFSTAVLPHGRDARMVEFVDWKREHLARIFGASNAHFEGVPGAGVRPQIRTIEGKSCVVGYMLALDIDDKYAFDIDEPVDLTLTYATEYTGPFVVGWDKSGASGQGLTEFTPPARDKLEATTLRLDRARLAGQGVRASDIAIGAPQGIALCDLVVKRSGATVVPTSFGALALTVKDAQTGATVPARIGLYDASGRMPLVSDQALKLQRYGDDLRMLPVNERMFWPSENRQAFYVDGKYETRLPPGKYEVIATRGPEFKAHKSRFEITKDRATPVTIPLERYTDMPAKGWYSGDSHIHVTRDEVADPNIWGFVAAEDVHVGNLLEMGNINSLYYRQPAAWGKASRFERDGHFLVSGLEAPRTRQFGHTIHLDVAKPVHLKTEDYFLYHQVFEQIQAEGGISGFAHMGWREGGTGGNPPGEGRMDRGVALLAPFGLIDFIEVLQGGRFMSSAWYRLLNLGYRIKPAAGTDWPVGDFPGAVRQYVKVNGAFNLDAWFASFNAGHVFVSNGPFLEFTANGRMMGDELRVKRGTTLNIAASATLNPEVDSLDRLELVVLGDVSQTQSAQGKDRVQLRTTLKVEHSIWVAVRAFGSRQGPRNTIIAHSAPIYVVVEDEPTWKREAVPTILAEVRDRLRRILTDPIDSPIVNNEPWETRLTLTDQWIHQQPLLRPRVNAADALYQKLLDDWTARGGQPARPTS